MVPKLLQSVKASSIYSAIGAERFRSCELAVPRRFVVFAPSNYYTNFGVTFVARFIISYVREGVDKLHCGVFLLVTYGKELDTRLDVVQQ